MAITNLPTADYNADLRRTTRNSASDPFASVAAYSDQQSAALPLLTPTSYCARPELFLSEAADTYIPRNSYESEAAYSIRLSSALSSFEPYYRSLKNVTVGTALRKPIALAEDISTPDWDALINNASLDGESLTIFARRLLDSAIDAGWAGVLVDYPKVDASLNLAQEKALGLRPYLSMIPMADVLGWQTTAETTQIGDEVRYGERLKQLRIRDSVTEPDPDDEFHEIVRPAVRVFDQSDADSNVTCRLFVLKAPQAGQQERWTLVDETTLGISVIPFVPCYAGEQEGFMRCRPLLLDIARLNLSHWQTAADLAHSLHLTSSPTLVISGVETQGEGADLSVSPDKSLFLASPDSKAQWIGAPSNGADVMLTRLKELEVSMQHLAPVQLQTKTTTGVEAAAAKKLDRAQSDSQLSVIVSQLEDALNQSLAIAALYMGEPPVALTLPRDFGPEPMEPNEIKEYSALVASGLLSHSTFLRKLQAAEAFDALDEWSVEDELETLEDERPAIDATQLPPEEDTDEDEDDENQNVAGELDGITGDEPTSSDA